MKGSSPNSQRPYQRDPQETTVHEQAHIPRPGTLSHHIPTRDHQNGLLLQGTPWLY